MRVIIDGIIYGSNFQGGIARYFTEVLREMPLLNPDLRLNVIVPPGAYRPDFLSCRTSGRLTTSFLVARGDIFHTSYYTHWPRLKCPGVVTVYDYIDASFPLLQPNGNGFAERQLDVIRRAAAVIAISRSTRDLTIELAGIEPEKVFVAYPGVSAPFSTSGPTVKEVNLFRQKLTGGAPYLIHVGMRNNYKNFRTILRAFCLAANSMDRHLVIMGGKFPLTAEEMDWVISSRLLDRIHFYPRVDDMTLRLAYAGADAMVHASLMEGFGIPVIEALACGTGLILSDIPVYREIADGLALFVDPTDIEAWVIAMKEELPVVALASQEMIVQQYAWQAAAREHLRAYASVLR